MLGFDDEKFVESVIEKGEILLMYALHSVERPHKPLPTQCYRCQQFGHCQTICTNKRRCRYCGEDHKSRSCRSSVLRCALCRGGHEAGSTDCPKHPIYNPRSKFYQADAVLPQTPAVTKSRVAAKKPKPQRVQIKASDSGSRGWKTGLQQPQQAARPEK